jgi:hypothetical protein
MVGPFVFPVWQTLNLWKYYSFENMLCGHTPCILNSDYCHLDIIPMPEVIGTRHWVIGARHPGQRDGLHRSKVECRITQRCCAIFQNNRKVTCTVKSVKARKVIPSGMYFLCWRKGIVRGMATDVWRNCAIYEQETLYAELRALVL